MKLLFNLLSLLLLLFGPNLTQSREIILIENQASLEEGILLKKILKEKFHFPAKLITLKNIHSQCEIKTEAIIHLCLKTSGELEVIKMNEYVVKNSFGTFLNSTEEIKNE